MNAPDLLQALGPVLAALQELGVRHYVGGSIASSAHGLARASIDADVVAEMRAEHCDRLVSALAAAYYVSGDRVRDAVARRASFNVIHLDTMVKVDVFVAKGRPFDQRAMDRARSHPSSEPGVPAIRLASAEDIVLAKLEWYRRGGEISDRQWTDVLGVLRTSGPSLDLRYLEAGGRELAVADLLARALGEAGSDS